MKALTTTEKFELIRHHGEKLGSVMLGTRCTKRSEVIESAERILEIAKNKSETRMGHRRLIEAKP